MKMAMFDKPDKNEEDAKDESKQKENKSKQNKKKVKRRAIKMLPAFLTILIFLMIGSAVFAIFSSLFDAIKETIQSIGNAIVEFFIGSNTSLEIDDDQLDKLITKIEATGVDLEDLELLR